MERQIGEIFDYNGTKLEVVENEDNHCEGCYFYRWIICRFDGIIDITGNCAPTYRNDKMNVIFKEVKE